MSIRKRLRNILPSISTTEQEALDAGDVWLEQGIYQGNPDFVALRNMTNASLSNEEQAFLDGPVIELLKLIDDFAIQNENHLPEKVLTFLKKNKFFSLIIPKAYGGLEFSPYANSTIVATISVKSTAIAVTVMVPNSLGPGELLMHYGTEKQRQYWLPRLSEGLDIPCFALTSPEAGSDAGSIPDTAIVTKGFYEGKEVIGLSVTWNKRYITLAPIASVLGLAFKVIDPNGLLGEKKELGITCALIPRNHGGVELGNRHNPMGMRFYNGTTCGQDVFIPMDFIIGGQSNIGKGWQMLVSCLGAGRGISLPALGASVSQVALKSASEYAVIREQFGLSIGKFEGIQEKLADIAGKTYLQEAMRHLTTEGLNSGLKPSVITAIAKYHMTELGRDVLNSAMDIQAGKAIQLGPQNTLASGYIAQPIAITVEGANILTRNLMIFGQGVMRCHPHLQALVNTIHSEDSDADSKFYGILKKTIKYSLKNTLAALKNGMFPYLIKTQSGLPEVKQYERDIHALASKLAIFADFSLLILGGKLKQAEMLSARLGDMMSYLYAAMASIRYYESKVDIHDRQSAEAYFHYATTWALNEAEMAMHQFLRNFPSVISRQLMRFLTISYWSRISPIDDKLVKKLAKECQKNTKFKQQLTHLIKPIAGDGHFINEQAYLAKLSCNDLLIKLEKAMKKGQLDKSLNFVDTLSLALNNQLIDDKEYKLLVDYNIKRERAIRVDEFDFDLNILPVSSDLKIAN